jgi:hypothetical protein
VGVFNLLVIALAPVFVVIWPMFRTRCVTRQEFCTLIAPPFGLAATVNEPGECGNPRVQISSGVHSGSEIVVHYRGIEDHRQNLLLILSASYRVSEVFPTGSGTLHTSERFM